eukprot:gene8677-17911_t
MFQKDILEALFFSNLSCKTDIFKIMSKKSNTGKTQQTSLFSFFRKAAIKSSSPSIELINNNSEQTKEVIINSNAKFNPKSNNGSSHASNKSRNFQRIRKGAMDNDDDEDCVSNPNKRTPRELIPMNIVAVNSSGKNEAEFDYDDNSSEDWCMDCDNSEEHSKLKRKRIKLSLPSRIHISECEEIARNRMGWKSSLHQFELDISNMQVTLQKIENWELKVDVTNKDRKDNENSISRKELIDDSHYYNTICLKCTHVCHANNDFKEIVQSENLLILGCTAFPGGAKCSACPGHCDQTHHYYSTKTVRKELRNETLEALESRINELLDET